MDFSTVVCRALGAQCLRGETGMPGHEGQGDLPEPQEMTSPGEGSIHHQHYWISMVTLALASEERQPAEEDSAIVWEYMAEPPQPHQSD